MWNDTDLPLAYLITFRAYGTWLHGDQRGSIDRFHNRYKTPYIGPNPRWTHHNARSLKRGAVILDAAQRKSVERSIHANCDCRGWHLYALSVRTNHVHIVVSIGSLKPERALIAFKANATKQMRLDGCWKTGLKSMGRKREQEVFVERTKRRASD